MRDGSPGHGRFGPGAERLRSRERIDRLEPERVASLSLEDISPNSMLDIGTGTGLFAETFAKRGIAVVGIDVRADFLEIARGHVPSGEFIEAGAEKLPFAGNSFDLVFLGYVLHEAEDPSKALEESRRVARMRVVVLEWPYAEAVHGPPRSHRLKPEKIRSMATNAGLREPELIPLDHADLYRFRP